MLLLLNVILPIACLVGALLILWALILLLVVGHRWLALNPAPKARVVEYDAEGHQI